MELRQNKGDAFLLATGYVKDTEAMTDQAFLYETLRELPGVIGMNAITKPIVSVAENNPGLEGYVPIDESNITVSTYTDNPRFVACIHSCKDFDYQKTVLFLKTKYQTTEIRFQYLCEADFHEKAGN